MVQAEASAAREQILPAEECRAQLHRILNSVDFEATDREHRFLKHVVEETLSGHGSRIKAYSIAVEVFGRDVTFDPQSDPIVRIEAGHLRRSLERYYFTAGHADPVLITIPKGGYVPVFSIRPLPPPTDLPANPVAPVTTTTPAWRKLYRLSGALVVVAALAVTAALAWWWGNAARVDPATPEIPRLLVERFDDLTGTDSSSAIATGLKQEIVGQLSKFQDIVVIESAAAETDTSSPPPRFVLAGSVNLSVDAFRLRVRLIKRVDDSVLWAESYDGGMKAAELLEAQADIARNVATSLAQSYGVIFQADANLRVNNPPDDWAAYSCTLSFYAYRIDLDPKKRLSVRTCLEKAVGRFADYATAWGLLSLIYIDEYRFEFTINRASSLAALDRAFAAARRAVELDPLNIRGRQAEMLALYFSEEIDAALRVGKQALTTNPNDTELMGEYGHRLALSGNWHDGCSLIGEARQRNPGSLGYYEADLALCSYFSGDYPQAAMWIKNSPVPSNAIYHLIAAAVFGEGGFEIEAERERVWLEKNEPALVKNLQQEVSKRLARSQDVEVFIGSLRKAGLDIEESLP